MLRRALILLCAFATGLLLLAAPAGAQNPNDLARGHAADEKFALDFTAVATPHGAAGHARITAASTPESVMSGPVTCLFVSDGYAVLVGEVTFTQGPDFGYAHSFQLAVRDNAGTAPDQFNIQASSSPPPDQCKTGVSLTSAVTEGDIVVHDG